MALSTVAGRNVLATAFAANATHLALFTASGTEASYSGYARRPLTWGAASNGTVSASAVAFATAPAGQTFTHVGYYTAITGGNLLDQVDTPDQSLNNSGIINVNPISFTAN